MSPPVRRSKRAEQREIAEGVVVEMARRLQSAWQPEYAGIVRTAVSLAFQAEDDDRA